MTQRQFAVTRICATFVVAGLVASNAVSAEENSREAPTPWVTGRAGLGAIAFPRYIGGTRYSVWPVPLLAVEFGERAYIDYWEGGVYLAATENKRLALSILATPRIGFGAKDGARLADMMTRRSSLEAGFAAAYAIGEGGVRVAYLRDVTGASKGSTLQLGVAQRFELTSRFGVDAFATVSRLDAKTADYYFGVRDSEATAARLSYRPGSASSAYAGLRFNYDLDQRRTILFGYEATWLGSALADSPIVERRVGSILYIGYGWRL